MKLCHGLLTASMVFLAASTGSAQTSQVFNRGDITETHAVDWGVLGPDFWTTADPFTLALVGGLTMTVSGPAGTVFERRNQGPLWLDVWDAPDPNMLLAHESGPISFVFNHAINAFGFNVKTYAFGNFDAFMSAYDADGNLLGSVYRFGQSQQMIAPIFLGIQSTSDIYRVDVMLENLASYGPDQEGVHTPVFNNASIYQATAPTTVPEPISLTLLGTGLAVLGAVKRRRRTSAS